MDRFPHAAVVAVITALALVYYALVFCLLAKKSGYPAWRGLLIFVPLVNFIVGLFWLFDQWPVQDQLDLVRSQLSRYEERYGPLDRDGDE